MHDFEGADAEQRPMGRHAAQVQVLYLVQPCSKQQQPYVMGMPC